MKLELKHLAGYLPYGLKFDGKRFGWQNFDGNPKILCPSDLDGRWEMIKPILHPLKDLKRGGIDDDCLRWLLVKDINEIKLSTYNFLMENHFDIYGLIEHDLAIDINTLNKC